VNPVLDASPWPGVVIWIVLYVSDFLFTMTCARLYQAGVRNVVVFEGSYEITPYYQKDVDSLRMVSPRFLLALTLTSALLYLSWWMSQESDTYYFYPLMFGAFVLLELAIHVRHVRNLFLFRAVLASGGIRGRIEYDRPVMLRLSAIELMTFAGVFAVIFLVTLNWFVLGGALTCFTTALKHRSLARAERLLTSQRNRRIDA
jgi:hypothetical protein